MEEYLLNWIVKRVSSPTTNININSDLPFTGKPLFTCCLITEREIIALVKAEKAKVFCDVPFKKLHIKWKQQILRTAGIFSGYSIPFWTFSYEEILVALFYNFRMDYIPCNIELLECLERKMLLDFFSWMLTLTYSLYLDM